MSADQCNYALTKYIPWVSTALLGVYVIYQFLKKDKSSEWVNKSVQKDVPKVATACDIEDLGEKTAFCRCWRTKKWPYCDGSHTEHNKCTGDNVGPVVIKRETK